MPGAASLRACHSCDLPAEQPAARFAWLLTQLRHSPRVEAKTFFFKDGLEKEKGLGEDQANPLDPLGLVAWRGLWAEEEGPRFFFSTLHQFAHVVTGLDREV